MQKNGLWRYVSSLSASLLLLVLLQGCATVHDMSVTKKTESLKLNGKGLVLMSMEAKNDFKPKYQPSILLAYVEKPKAKSKKDRHNFLTDLDGTIVTSKGTRYLLRMELEPGEYIIRGAHCQYQSMFLMGTCMLPLHANINVKANTVTYVGRVSGVMRKREDGELRAGEVIPLVDQAVTGFAQSTFDVAVKDRSHEDIKAYRSTFPVLAKTNIQTKILPPYDKKRAYAWWKSNGGSEAPEQVASKDQGGFSL